MPNLTQNEAHNSQFTNDDCINQIFTYADLTSITLFGATSKHHYALAKAYKKNNYPYFAPTVQVNSPCLAFAKKKLFIDDEHVLETNKKIHISGKEIFFNAINYCVKLEGVGNYISFNKTIDQYKDYKPGDIKPNQLSFEEFIFFAHERYMPPKDMFESRRYYTSLVDNNYGREFVIQNYYILDGVKLPENSPSGFPKFKVVYKNRSNELWIGELEFEIQLDQDNELKIDSNITEQIPLQQEVNVDLPLPVCFFEDGRFVIGYDNTLFIYNADNTESGTISYPEEVYISKLKSFADDTFICATVNNKQSTVSLELRNKTTLECIHHTHFKQRGLNSLAIYDNNIFCLSSDGVITITHKDRSTVSHFKLGKGYSDLNVFPNGELLVLNQYCSVFTTISYSPDITAVKEKTLSGIKTHEEEAVAQLKAYAQEIEQGKNVWGFFNWQAKYIKQFSYQSLVELVPLLKDYPNFRKNENRFWQLFSNSPDFDKFKQRIHKRLSTLVEENPELKTKDDFSVLAKLVNYDLPEKQLAYRPR